jgi:integrase
MARKQPTRGTDNEPSATPSPGAVAKLNRSATPKAYELLAQQPVSLIGLSPEDRNQVVVTAVADDKGQEHIVSRFGDASWDLSSEFKAVNKTARARRIDWPKNVPAALVDDAKAAVYCALRQGRNEMDFSASTAVHYGKAAAVTLRHLSSLGIEHFGQVRALHISDHLQDLKKSIGETTIKMRLGILDIVWSFGGEMNYPLAEHPFAGKALYDAAGVEQQDFSAPAGRTGKTPVIPPRIQAALWEQCEKVLWQAEVLFDDRDRGLMQPSNTRLIAIRDAVLYQLQVTSGMRNSESTGLTNGCWREDEKAVRDGKREIFHWVRTREIKTTGGKELDYLVPRELFVSLVVLQRLAQPLQQRLGDEAEWLEHILSAGIPADCKLENGMTVPEAVQRLNRVREIGNHLFLTVGSTKSDHLNTGSRVEVLSVEAGNRALQRLAHDAGVDWKMGNHQCRRTFAWNVANSRMGRNGLIFLKWQLKHASISWTQLYAANPHQDQALYDDFADAMWESKVDLMTSWHGADVRLSGGAGKKLLQTRAIPVKNFRQLLEATAASVNVRSTGHAWCMSGTQGCHGQGIYDPTLCGGCSSAVIDESHGSRWQMIHLDNLRLAAITDCGPAVEAKAKKGIEMSTQVLSDLGVPLPSAEQARAYERGEWDQ